MALNFPDSPSLNQIYTDNTSGFSYQWNGTVWISYSAASSNNIKTLDDISASFNSSTLIFPLTSGGTAVTPASPQQLIISVGGVMQSPNTDYSVSGSNIIFTTAPQSGLTFFGTLIGPAVPVNTVADGSITPPKLSTGGPSWNTSGDVYIAGITTITNSSGTVTVGVGTTALLVQGNARVTGILTVGSSSITLNGSTDRITVGTGLTLSSSGIIAGVITATTFSGNATGLSGTPNLNVGVITATSFVGNGSGLTGAGSTVANDTTTNQTFYPLFTTQTSGTVTASKVSTTKLTFNPSTGLVVAGIVSATGIGTLGTNGIGARTVSTSAPTGGSDGDIWYKY